ncbi:carbohydrate sulfotransferase 1-like [Clytia hemisphaerica]|uniref:Sulfotransferase domain-containing protein n=1 Tax=Clytia hemisphaerica TaxID=252671 RepID=A0A7M5UPY0_9CNID
MVRLKSRKTKIIIIGLLLSIYVLICWTQFSSIIKFLPGNLTNRKTKKAIFIVGPGRTGTSLLGDLFNSQDDVIYLFEPLRAIHQYYGRDFFFDVDSSANNQEKFYAQEAKEFLKDIVTCNYQKKHDHYLKYLESPKMNHRRSKVLTMAPFCDAKTHKCRKIDSQLMNQLCVKNEYKIVVKELSFRMPFGRMSSLEDLSLPEHYQILLIHSMRDPRAFLFSKYQLHWFHEQQPNPMKRVKPFVDLSCSLIRKNMNHFLKTTHHEELHDHSTIKYKVLRYEDLQTNLTSLGNSLEKFLGFPSDIPKYFESKTRSRTRPKIRTTKKIFSKRFSTSPRDISTVSDKWRLMMNHDLVQTIQGSCNGVMKILGYKSVHSIQSQRNKSLLLFNGKPQISALIK